MNKKYTTSRRRADQHRQRGISLLETTIAVTLLSLIFLGTISLFTMASRSSARTTSKVFAGQDAANTIQKLIQDLRESRWVALPGDTGTKPFTARAGYTSVSNYTTTVSGQTVNTAIMFTMPAISPTNFTVTTSAGARILSGSNALYQRSVDGKQVLVYRSDSAGVPSAAAGTYLWAYSLSDNGTSVNRALVRSIAGAGDAVQFVRPLDMGGAVLPNQIEIKVTTAYVSGGNATQTSEESNGTTVSTLTGKCVLIRNR